MAESKEQEKRRTFERFVARFPVKFQHGRGDYGQDVFLIDASAQGVKFTTKKQMYLHDSISLEVELPDGKKPLELNGKVVWTKKRAPDLWDVGLEFHKIQLMQMQRMFKQVEPTDYPLPENYE